MVPNPGDAATVATGAAGEVTVVGAPPVTPTGETPPETGGPAVAGADITVEVEDNAPVPQPTTAVRTATSATTATTDEARQRNP